MGYYITLFDQLLFFCFFFFLLYFFFCGSLFLCVFLFVGFGLDVFFVRFFLLFLECFSCIIRSLSIFLRLFCNLLSSHILCLLLFVIFYFFFFVFVCFVCFVL